MKKVCILTHTLDTKGGAGRHALDLIKNLNKNGIKTKVLTSSGIGLNIEEPIIYSNKLKLLFSLRKIRKIIKECDIVHALDVFPFGIVAVIASVGLKKKIVITAIGSNSVQPLYRLGISTLSKLAFKRADTLTAISNYVAREINKKSLNLDFKVIIPGINYDYFVNKSYKRGIIKETPYILSVAKLKPRKGHHISLRAFKKASEKLTDLNYVIVGGGRSKYFFEIKKLILELGIKNKVFFKENISDEELVSLYRNAEMFMLLPQNKDNDIEGFGLVFVEAAAFGVPVIGAWDSGAEDAILDKQNGFLVTPEDVEDASQKIIDIASNKKLREEFSKKSVEFAKKNDWANIIKQYIEVYELLF